MVSVKNKISLEYCGWNGGAIKEAISEGMHYNVRDKINRGIDKNILVRLFLATYTGARGLVH